MLSHGAIYARSWRSFCLFVAFILPIYGVVYACRAQEVPDVEPFKLERCCLWCYSCSNRLWVLFVVIVILFMLIIVLFVLFKGLHMMLFMRIMVLFMP